MDPVFVEFHRNGHRFKGHVNFIGPVLSVIFEHLPVGDGFRIELKESSDFGESEIPGLTPGNERIGIQLQFIKRHQFLLSC